MPHSQNTKRGVTILEPPIFCLKVASHTPPRWLHSQSVQPVWSNNASHSRIKDITTAMLKGDSKEWAPSRAQTSSPLFMPGWKVAIGSWRRSPAVPPLPGSDPPAPMALTCRRKYYINNLSSFLRGSQNTQWGQSCECQNNYLRQ